MRMRSFSRAVYPSTVNTPLLPAVSVAPIPPAPLLYAGEFGRTATVAAATATAGFTPAIALAIAVVTNEVLAALVELSPAEGVGTLTCAARDASRMEVVLSHVTSTAPPRTPPSLN